MNTLSTTNSKITVYPYKTIIFLDVTRYILDNYYFWDFYFSFTVEVVDTYSCLEFPVST